MSALTEASNDEQAAELLAAHNIIDGLSLVIAKQQAVMRQALEALEKYQQKMFAEAGCRWVGGDAAVTALRNSLEGKQ